MVTDHSKFLYNTMLIRNADFPHKAQDRRWNADKPSATLDP